MYRTFIVIAFATLTHVSGSAGLKFPINKDLNNSKDLDKTDWSYVEITPAESSITVKFDIPLSLPYSDVFLFFANDNKHILQVSFKETVLGKLYTAPYNFKQEKKGEAVTKADDDQYHHVSGIVPQEWLPDKFNKLSATVVTEDGKYYNSYKIQNFQISIPDLMVVEEYENV